MDLRLQAKLLRALQEKEVEVIGSRYPKKVDVRVIATTNRDIRRLVNDGKFREDLYYRLNVFPLYIPPLRERKEDIPELVNHLLKKHSKGMDIMIDDEAMTF
jgi:transcriptional regulator with PAS, ATPase and Fis domain